MGRWPPVLCGMDVYCWLHGLDIQHTNHRGGGGDKSDPHFPAFFRIFSRIFPPAASLLTKEEMHCTFVFVYRFHPLSDW